MILDTSFVIDVMEEKEEAVLKLKEIIKSGDLQLITSLTIFELFTGLARSKRPTEERNKITKVLEGQNIISFDKESAEIGGEIDGKLIADGNGINIVDSMIAGIALIKKEKIVTRNIKDFSRIKNLEIETY